MRAARAVVLVVGLILNSRLVSAQAVRGQVVDSVSGGGVPTGFVVLLDRDRTEVARALADREGRFVLTAPRAGTYRLRSERIGFRAVTSTPFTLEPGVTLDYRLIVSALPVRLASLAISGETACRALGEQQAALAVWDEARKALAAVAWGERDRMVFDLRLQDRMLGPDLDVRTESVRLVSGTASRPFTTPAPAEIGFRGYVRPLPDGGRAFDGPDARILFSSEFLSQHCFRAVASGKAEGLVGLAFEPVRSRRVADIAGTIWLDDRSAELRFVEYHYVNHGLPGVDREATGLVEFEPLTDGNWIVRRWRIRLPVVRAATDEVSLDVRRLGVSRRPEVSAFVENAGEVVRASFQGTVVATRRPASTVIGRVTDEQGQPVGGAIVQLVGTTYGGTSFPDGRVRLEGVTEGTYSVKYIHPVVPGLGAVEAPGLALTVQPGADTAFDLVLPDVVALLDQSCPGRNAPEHYSALAGGVRRIPNLAAVTGLKVKVVYPHWTVRNVGGSAVATNAWESVETESKATGHYLACDLPPDQDATLYALSGKEEREIARLRIMADTIHQRNLGVQGDSVFVR